MFHIGTPLPAKIIFFANDYQFVSYLWGYRYTVCRLTQSKKEYVMFHHFLKTTFINLKRNPVYSFINIAGLAVGLAASMLILLHVVNEYSYDRFHTNRDRLMMVLFQYKGETASGYSNTITAAVGPTLYNEIPGIENFVRLTWPRKSFLSFNDTVRTVDGLRFADSSFFDCFSFRMETGDVHQQLRQPFTMVITRSLANQCFPGQNPIGKTVKIDGRYNVTITGIAADPPANTQLGFKALVSFSTLYKDENLYMDWNGGNQYINWLLVSPSFDMNHAKQLLPGLLDRHINNRLREAGVQLQLDFEPISQVYLYSKSRAEGNPFMLRILMSIALFILLLACFNYANLSTARAMRRFRETGIRKVAGATSGSLLRFYMGESFITALIAWFIALILIELVQPWFNGMVGHELGLWKAGVWWFVPASLLIVLLTAIISGLYPSLFLSRMQPSSVLKGGFNPGRRRLRLSSLLLVIQFALSSALMTGTLIIGRQLDYGTSLNRGFNTRDVLAVELTGAQSQKKYAEAKNAMTHIAGVEAVTAISEIPVNGISQNGYRIEGEKKVRMIRSIETDPDFFKVLQVPVIAGTDFAHSSEKHAVMINQKLAEEAGWMDSEGRPLADSMGSLTGGVGKIIIRDTLHRVVGITANFHHATLYEPLSSVIIARQPYVGYNYLMIRVMPGHLHNVAAEAENSWRNLFPEEPFVSYPVETMIKQGFDTERNLESLLNAFAWLALFIAALGLVGLASYQTRQRQRDTGLRRILGASPSGLIVRDSFRFLRLVMAAHFITLPLVYWAMDSWLQSFIYHIPFPWWLTVPVLLVLLFTGISTVILQVIKTIRANPIEAIRYE